MCPTSVSPSWSTQTTGQSFKEAQVPLHGSDGDRVLAFGMKTPMTDKLSIMKAVEQICLAQKLTDFEFHQARYSRRDRKMYLALLRSLHISLPETG
jgi:hypothetical protein